ncbi:TPA: EAL domain-containing protein [Escherichia coli]|nr:EAL domain-containing protein [Escherichia coli]HDW2612546.1 EAL domain-containing protein [Escherichia coli]
MDSNFVSADRLMRALSNGEFEPYLQPVVSASDLTVSGAELLVRWHMPAGEIIPPAYFINRMESAGLLPDMTRRLMLQAVNALSGIKSMLPDNFRLAVNVTPTLLTDSRFIQMCLMLAEEGKIRLVLELTEQQPFNADWQTEWMLGLLNDAGVEIALDDFGTGCSVLSYLKHFPVSYIKMDKSFIQDVLSEDTSWNIVESVVGLAGKLGIDTVAEGVETQAQVNCLCTLGVDYLQGFYFGRPEKVDTFCCEYKQRQWCNQ